MNTIKRLLSRGSALSVAMAFGVVVAVQMFSAGGTVMAAGQMSQQQLQIGSSAVGATTSYTFTFTPSTGTVGSMVFEFCESPFVGTTCTAPTGIDTSSAAVGTNSGFTGTFTKDTSTSTSTGWFVGQTCATTNCILIKASSGAAQSASAHVMTFTGVKNPTADDTGNYYVRLVTFSDIAYTTETDEGSVMFSIDDQIAITAKVQEKLNFSVAGASGLSAPGTTCPAISGGNTFNIGDVNGVLDPSTAYDGHSYFRLSTNSANGTAVQYSGDTLKSGANSINAPSTQTASTVGTEQFGIGFDSADATANAWNGSDLGTPVAGYGNGNGTIQAGATAKFDYSTASATTPVTIISSTGVVNCNTRSVRYIANISTTTKPGIYTTTVGYIAVPKY